MKTPEPALLVCLAAFALLTPRARAQTISNPSFESNTFTIFPGYVSANGPITGWTAVGNVGLNPASGNQFADNGATPQGVNVAFLESGGSLSNSITGLLPGLTYQVNFRSNCRTGGGAGIPVPVISVNSGSFSSFLASPAVGPLGSFNPYYFSSTAFIATASTASLVIANQGGFNTALLVDNFSVTVLTVSPPTATTLPASGVSNTAATLNATVNPNSTNARVWFEWGTMTNYYSQTSVPVAFGGGVTLAVSNTLTGLTPGIRYHAIVAASNALGVVRGQDVTFGSPAIALNSANPYTNQCHFAFTDSATASFGLLLAIAGGDRHSLAVKSDGRVIAWGDNSSDQTNVPVGLSNVMAIASGSYHSLALKIDGTVVAWGENGSGQLNVPVGLSNVTAIAGGGAHSLALKSNGTVVGWGRSAEGQTTIPVGLSNVVAIAGGGFYSLALKNDGTVAAWGFNLYGQTNIPVGLSNVVAIVSGFAHSLALKSDGSVVAWGDNGFGQTNVPVGLSNVVAIASGVNHSLALKSDGTVVAWGENSFGQTNVPAGLSSNPFTVSGSVNTNSPGNYLLTYTATNSLGGIAAPITRTVVVVDTLPPVITMTGTNYLLITSPANLPLPDPGVTAVDLCGGNYFVVVSNAANVNFPGTYITTYRATDASGNTAATNRTVIVALPPAVPGDQNGDGLVNQSELDAVYASYVTNSPWFYMTNVVGLGGTNVTFALSDSVFGTYTVESSTNLLNWQPLGPARPRYLFEDTNAPAVPQRYYRLRYP